MKIVRQRDEVDCGVCALASIIRHYKGNVPLEIIRLDARTDNEGTTALNLILAAQKYGLDGSGYEVDNLKNIPRLPAIAHLKLKNGLNHYVVIYKITKDKITLMDPAKGKVIKSKKQFLMEWSKVIIVFYPKRKITVLKNEVTIFKLLKQFLKQDKKLIKSIIFLNILLTFLAIVGGFYFQVMASVINGFYPRKYVCYLIGIFALFIIMKIIFQKISLYLKNHLYKNVTCSLYRDFFLHLYNLPLNTITSRKSGEIMRRVEELGQIKEIIVNIILQFNLDLLLIILGGFLLIIINKSMFLVLLIFLFLYFLGGIVTFKKIFKLAYQNIGYQAEFNNNLLEDVKMFNSIKNTNNVELALCELERKTSKYIYDTYKFNNYLNKVNTYKFNIFEISMFVLMTYGFYLVYKKSINVLELVTFNSILNLFLTPFKSIIESLPQLSLLKASIVKINEFLSINEEKLGKKVDLKNYEIKIDDLTYSYNKYLLVINKINMEIKMGDFVLIKGPSGCGKSTLCNILVKNIEDYKGSIYIGGINLKNVSLNTIRNNILYINQNESLKTGTIYENIVMQRNVELETLERVIDLCEVNKILDNKPLGLDTLINNDDSTISGGEKERIILARGLLNDFKILILDEALSEIDIDMELNILSNIKKHFKDKTIIFISHKKYKKIFDKEINLCI